MKPAMNPTNEATRDAIYRLMALPEWQMYKSYLVGLQRHHISLAYTSDNKGDSGVVFGLEMAIEPPICK